MMITLISFSRFYCWLITSVFGFQKPDAAAPTHSLQQDLRMLGPSFAATWVYKTADAVVYNRFLVFVQTRFCFCFWRKSIGLWGVDCALILSPLTRESNWEFQGHCSEQDAEVLEIGEGNGLLVQREILNASNMSIGLSVTSKSNKRKEIFRNFCSFCSGITGNNNPRNL